MCIVSIFKTESYSESLSFTILSNFDNYPQIHTILQPKYCELACIVNTSIKACLDIILKLNKYAGNVSHF